ncbi:hypothetical protein HDU91_006712, partial [Kappamyces sp. JEL0680]
MKNNGWVQLAEGTVQIPLIQYIVEQMLQRRKMLLETNTILASLKVGKLHSLKNHPMPGKIVQFTKAEASNYSQKFNCAIDIK